jgi:hypothetical protein
METSTSDLWTWKVVARATLMLSLFTLNCAVDMPVHVMVVVIAVVAIALAAK